MEDAPLTTEADLKSPEEIASASAKHLRDLALTLFDGTRSLHDLSEESRNILEQAALLYDLPIPAKNKKTHKAAVTSLHEHLSQEMTAEEENSLAAIIAGQQGKLKRKAIVRLDLTPTQQREVLTHTALLNIAAGLDHSGSQGTTIQKVEADRDRVWIVVDGPEAAADAAAAQHKARLWEKVGYPPARVLESAQAAVKLVPFPEPTEEIGLQPADTLAEAGRKVMRFHFARMLQYEPGTRLGDDIEALHDMRVATRRLRAAFEVFGDAFEPGALKSHLRGLRATGRALGLVRDLDVFMEKAQHYLDSLPEGQHSGLDPLLGDWQAQRESARTQLLAHLDSQEYAAFKRKFNIFINTPGAGARKIPKDQPTPDQVRELAPILIYTRLAAVRAYAPFMDDAPIERFHALRIEFKKLRYTVEYFQEPLGKNAKDVINDLKKLQDHLGDLNDAQVATQLVSQFIEAWEAQQNDLPVNERQNIEAVVNYLAYRYAERHQLMVTFRPAWRLFQRPGFRRNLARAVSVL